MPDLIWEIDDQDGVFLTFDDGPTPGVTEWILSTLDKYDAKATFFVLGKNVEMYPDLYQRILDAGHRVGNHTYSHQKGWGVSRTTNTSRRRSLSITSAARSIRLCAVPAATRPTVPTVDGTTAMPS